MVSQRFKSLLVVAFSLCSLFFSNMSCAQNGNTQAKEETERKEPSPLNPSKLILEHIGDAHEFHFFTLDRKPVSLPLPVILYSPAKGWSVFMSSQFEHGA